MEPRFSWSRVPVDATNRSSSPLRDQSAPTLTFEVIRIGEWRDWIEHDLDFDGLIARACRHIEAVGTEGPLQLAGYSQGGQLAYATALALSRAGRSVGFVGLLDKYSDIPFRDKRPPKTSILSGVLRLASRYIGATVRGLKDLYHSGGVREPRCLHALAPMPRARGTKKAANVHRAIRTPAVPRPGRRKARPENSNNAIFGDVGRLVCEKCSGSLSAFAGFLVPLRRPGYSRPRLAVLLLGTSRSCPWRAPILRYSTQSTCPV